MTAIFSQPARYLAQNGILDRGERVVVGLSGGPDSLCLLHVLKRASEQLDLEIMALVVDHALREGSDDDAQKACDLSRQLGVLAEVVKIQAPVGNIQQWAREKRLEAFGVAAARFGAKTIALGHNASDQAETVLMRILRGIGTDGLVAMRPRVSNFGDLCLVRPLLGVDRSAIEAYLSEHGLVPLQDPTNSTSAYFRNRIRNDILPRLREENPRVDVALCRLADNADEERSVLAWASDVARTTAGVGGFLSAAALRGLPSGLVHRVIRDEIRQTVGNLAGIDRDHVLACADLLASSSGTRSLSLPGVRMTRAFDRVSFEKTGELLTPTQPFDVELSAIEDRTLLNLMPDRALVFSRLSDAADDGLLLNAQGMSFPLTVRSHRPGDRIAIGAGKRKKVARVLMEAKIPPASRPLTPLVVSNDEILLVVGLRRAAGAGPEDKGEAISVKWLQNEQ